MSQRSISFLFNYTGCNFSCEASAVKRNIIASMSVKGDNKFHFIRQFQLSWQKQIDIQKIHLRLIMTKYYRNSKLIIKNKLRIDNTIIKTVCTYGIQPWGRASTSNTLRMIANAPCYVSNKIINGDFKNSNNRRSCGLIQCKIYWKADHTPQFYCS